MDILYICAANATRSQIAEAFFNSMPGGHNAYSAGASAEVVEGAAPPETVVSCMHELGHDISMKQRKKLAPEMVQAADKVIVILEPHEVDAWVPDYVRECGKVEYWPVKDENGYEAHSRIRNEIKTKVEILLLEINEMNN